jgi:hypothetical protein
MRSGVIRRDGVMTLDPASFEHSPWDAVLLIFRCRIVMFYAELRRVACCPPWGTIEVGLLFRRLCDMFRLAVTQKLAGVLTLDSGER